MDAVVLLSQWKNQRQFGDNYIGQSLLTIGSKCYRVVSSSANYLQAILGCVSLGASLATVSSQAEQDAVFALTGASGAWIGLTDFLNEGSFSWVDESPLTFTNWRVNQPNNGNNNQHCTQVSLMVEHSRI